MFAFHGEISSGGVGGVRDGRFVDDDDGKIPLFNALNVAPTNSACRSELNSQKNAPPNLFSLI
jgi:hypothetical protein